MNPTLRTRVRLTAAVVGTLAAAALCACSGPQQHQDVSYAVTAPVNVLIVKGLTGDIDVQGGATRVGVVEHLSYSGTAPRTSHQVDNGALTLSYSGGSDAGVSYTVNVPSGIRVEVTDNTGKITLSGLAGDVSATDGSGDVEASGLSAATVRLTTGTGNVHAVFRSAPSRVDAGATTGDVSVGLPSGSSYAVTAQAGTGSTQVKVDQAAGSSHAIAAHTSTGQVSVLPE